MPEVHTDLSARRVLVTDLIEGARFQAIKERDDERATASARSCSASTSASSSPWAGSRATRIPGNYLLLDDGRVGFLDFGLMRVLDRGYLEREAQVVVAVEDDDAALVDAVLAELGDPPEPEEFEPRALLEQIRAMGADTSRASAASLCSGRPSDGLDERSVLAVLRADAAPDDPAPGAAHAAHGGSGALDAGGGPGGGGLARAIAREYYAGAAPATPLGEAERAFWSRSPITATASGFSSIST